MTPQNGQQFTGQATPELPHLQLEAIADPIGLIPELVQNSLDKLLQIL